MGVRSSFLWACCVFLSTACTEKVIQTVASSGPSNCDSSLNSVRTSTLSLSSDKKTRVGKIQLDSATILLPEEDNSFRQLLPTTFIQKNRGFRAHRVGQNQLAALIDHACTLQRGIDSHTRDRKNKVTLSASLMLAEDDSLQSFHNRVRKSTRAFAVPPNTTLEELAQMAEEDPCILVVGNNALYKTLTTPLDTHYAANLNQKVSYLDGMNFSTGWDKFIGNAATPIATDVTIAVIDSGVKIAHQDLNGNLWVNPSETAGNSIDDDGNGKVDDINGWNFVANVASPTPQTWVGYSGEEGHGTHVAGIIAAESDGTNQGVVGVISSHGKIMGLNVFGNQASATTTAIDNAITYAANKGADVINMSLGGEVFSATTQTAITNAVAAGTVVVAAAGNGDDDGYGLVLSTSYGVYPGSLAKDIDGMLSVGSFDKLSGERSVFSNCSATYVEISAPGAYDSTDYVNGGIPSTWATGTTNNLYAKQLGGYAIYGTSMSSPMVAGAAALAMSLYADQHGGTMPTPAVIETALTTSGSTTTALTPYVKNGKIIDLNALYTYIDAL